MIRIKLYNALYKLLFAFYFLILVMTPFKNTALVSLGTYAIFFCTFILFVNGLKAYVSAKNCLLVVLLLVISIFSMIISVGFDYTAFVRLLMFMELPLLLVSMPFKIEEDIIRFYSFGLIILSLFYVYVSFTDMAHVYYTEYGKTQLSALTLGYKNPNETSMYLFSALFGLANLYSISNRKLVKFLALAISGYLVYLIYLTESRAMLVISILLIAIFVFFRGKKPNKKMAKIITAIPFAFVAILLLFSSVLTTAVFLGDVFDTGRGTIYLRVFNNMSFVKFLFGDFSLQFENMHNAPLTVFSTIGIFGVVVFYIIILSRVFSKLNGEKENKGTYLGAWSILLLIMHSSVEAALFTSGSALSMCTFIAFLFAQYEVLDESIAN